MSKAPEHERERAFWIAVRRCLIILIRAIEERYEIPTALHKKE